MTTKIVYLLMKIYIFKSLRCQNERIATIRSIPGSMIKLIETELFLNQHIVCSAGSSLQNFNTMAVLRHSSRCFWSNEEASWSTRSGNISMQLIGQSSEFSSFKISPNTYTLETFLFYFGHNTCHYLTQ